MRSPIVLPILDYGLNKIFEQATNDSKMRSLVIPLIGFRIEQLLDEEAV